MGLSDWYSYTTLGSSQHMHMHMLRTQTRNPIFLVTMHFLRISLTTPLESAFQFSISLDKHNIIMTCSHNHVKYKSITERKQNNRRRMKNIDELNKRGRKIDEKKRRETKKLLLEYSQKFLVQKRAAKQINLIFLVSEGKYHQ